jgi:putative flippase GtrA
MWQHVRDSLVDWSALRFILVCLGNTLVGLLCIYAGKWLWQLGDIRANLLGYACGLSMSFLLNKRWSFRYHGRTGPALTRFLVVIGIAYLLNLAVVVGARDVWRLDSHLAHALGILPYTVCGYLGSRYFAFPQVPDPREHTL